MESKELFETYRSLKWLKRGVVDIDGVNQAQLFSSEPNFDEAIVRRLVMSLSFCFSFISSNRLELPFKEIRFYYLAKAATEDYPEKKTVLLYLRVEDKYYRAFTDAKNCFFDILGMVCRNLTRSMSNIRIRYYLEGNNG
jgi:hypothetical protein